MVVGLVYYVGVQAGRLDPRSYGWRARKLVARSSPG
jgi:hypothetical protein